MNNVITAIEYINGVDMNRQYPDTFQIPSDEDKAAIKVGDFVKIGITSESGGERFWGEVLEVSQHGVTVRVDNDLITEGLNFNYNDVLRNLSTQYILDILDGR